LNIVRKQNLFELTSEVESIICRIKEINMNKYQKYTVLICRSLSVLIILYGLLRTFFGSNQTLINLDDRGFAFILSNLISLFVSLIPGFVFFLLSERIGMWIGKNLDN
jgi:hypothetical protein